MIDLRLRSPLVPSGQPSVLFSVRLPEWSGMNLSHTIPLLSDTLLLQPTSPELLVVVVMLVVVVGVVGVVVVGAVVVMFVGVEVVVVIGVVVIGVEVVVVVGV